MTLRSLCLYDTLSLCLFVRICSCLLIAYSLQYLLLTARCPNVLDLVKLGTVNDIGMIEFVYRPSE